ncbi:uncharacterized protein C22orf15 [Salmo salar]|uniref:Uncharacterized protein C22orf15 n=1 Tax=Salmo salar TaxID=8030 RepID=A0A1S3NKF1_SALSA|nr:uncharacterized protein C22orf15 [Salmo salar]|eukprot:XP_014015899.1 PREDICTED: uncharacterized protein C22orf15-like isoform X1 [Salmo salar]
MFVTVQFGEGQTELFNLNCRVIDFIHNLKERCYLDSQDCVDLMDRTGELVNLSEKEKSMEQASSMMKERHSYVLIRICRGDGTEGQKYVPLLNDLSKSSPELAEVLKKLSNPCKEQDKKGGPSRKGSVNQIRRKPTAGNKKSHPGRLKDMKKGEEEG